MMIHQDTLLQFIVYLNFRIIISQLCVCIFGDDSQMTWIIVNICIKYVYLLSISCLKKYYVFFKQ